MNNFINSLKKEEKVTLDLRRHYEIFGYKRIKLSKFEDYELYTNNRDILGKEGILTFTNNTGKLMALRPDVTLSLLKKTSDTSLSTLNKLYYIETIYRRVRETGEFRELKQIGVECFGSKDDYSNLEIIQLALESLHAIDNNYILSVSHLGFLGGLLNELPNGNSNIKQQILSFISEKNTHDLERLLIENKTPQLIQTALLGIPKLYGDLDSVLTEAKKYVVSSSMQKSVDKLERLYNALHEIKKTDHIQVDFSLTANLDYYNGLIFNGYIRHLPERILAGGRYDRLSERFGHKTGAIGFAVFLDDINSYFPSEQEDDGRVLVLYDKKTNPGDLLKEVNDLTSKGERVYVKHIEDVPVGEKFKKTIVVGVK